MTKEERQQSLTAARIACKWLKDYLVHTPREPLLKPLELLIGGFEIFDDKEQKQIRAGNKGKKFGVLGAEHGKKGGRPKGKK